MSQKWQRSKAWDDEHIPSWAWPIRFLLRAFSSIALAVCLLVFVALYATLASVPVGMLALIPTWAIYSLSLAAPIVLAWCAVVLVMNAAIKHRPARFAACLAGIVATGVVITWAWGTYAWPALRYEPATGTGFRLFPEFCERYEATTLRRLPAFEMTELQFYAWWPLRVVLLTFVANLFVATVRRIEFNFKNIGVLTVHSGIIAIALGSMYYQKLKLEGDALVMAGFNPSTGEAGVGPPTTRFYDNTSVVLYTTQEHGGLNMPMWEQRPIPHLPRYNDYNIDAGTELGLTSAWERSGRPDPAAGIPPRSLDIPLPPTLGIVDEDISLRVVGYATYADLREDALRVPTTEGDSVRPMRFVALYMRVPTGHTQSDQPAFEFSLTPSEPVHRISENEAFGIEYTLAMDDQRWRDLITQVPPETENALVIEVPGNTPTSTVVPVEVGSEVKVGNTGYTVRVQQLSPTPPMPIITRGYEGSSSSVAVVRVTTPEGGGYQRWVYSRFPEINQDILDTTGATGRPMRRDADQKIRIAYLDMSKLEIYLDEQPDGRVRAAVRQRGGALRVVDDLPAGERLENIVDKIDIAIADKWENSVPFERPVPIPKAEQERDKVGSHAEAAVAVEVSATANGQPWKRVVWVPFSKYMGIDTSGERSIKLPDGRGLRLAFGRQQHRFPGFQVQLADFEMIAYDHRGAPRDYQSLLKVTPAALPGQDPPDFEPYEHICKLNAPLRAPFHWDPDKPWLSNVGLRLLSGLNPQQFKLSQAGWDQQGWARSQQMVEQGLLERPFVQFTILGVGNNPGIHVIALGGILMGVGIPWAFYLKPWLVRRERNKIQRGLAVTRAQPAHEAMEVTV